MNRPRRPRRGAEHCPLPTRPQSLHPRSRRLSPLRRDDKDEAITEAANQAIVTAYDSLTSSGSRLI
eukprot:1177708-Prorocentrum_minimum.AAC.3